MNPNGHAPFVFRNRYIWLEAGPETGVEGIVAEVRTNLPNGELRAFLENIRDLDLKRGVIFNEQALATKLAEEHRRAAMNDNDREGLLAALDETAAATKQTQAALAELDREMWALVAPHVRDWNVYDEDGKKVPPPSEDPESTFELADNPAITWLVDAVSTAYRSGKGVRPPSKKLDDLPEPTPAPSSGPQMVDA